MAWYRVRHTYHIPYIPLMERIWHIPDTAYIPINSIYMVYPYVVPTWAVHPLIGRMHTLYYTTCTAHVTYTVYSTNA